MFVRHDIMLTSISTRACLIVGIVVLVWSGAASVVGQYQDYRGVPLDNGQQYWQNHWQWHNQQYTPGQQSAPATQAAPVVPSAPFRDLQSYYPKPTRVDPPFTNVVPAPNAYQSYWPLMISPGWNYGYF